MQQVFTFAFQFYCITIRNIQYCVLYIILCLSGLLVFASPNRVRYFRGRVSNFVQSEARKQSLLASGGGNLRPFPKYTVLYKYEKDIFGKGDRLHTVNLIITSIMAYLVNSRGLEFASQLWLLSLIDRYIDGLPKPKKRGVDWCPHFLRYSNGRPQI